MDDSKLNKEVLADPTRLEQILINLIHNANKHTENGLIKVDVRDQDSFVKIEVSDTGIGIPSHDLSRIWDRFFKGNRHRSRDELGTGLDLAIVKELVQLHGGNIKVESELGKGSVFLLPHKNQSDSVTL